WRRSVTLASGVICVLLVVCGINLWRFDFFAPNSGNGFYLATRLFSVGGLYDRANGSASEELYTLAADCDIFLDSPEPDRNLEIVQGLRLCLFYEKRMNPDDI